MSDPEIPDLSEVLVLTVRKGFWASAECQVFPNIRYNRTLFPGQGRLGSSRNPLNVLNLLFQGYYYCLKRRPKVLLFGGAPRVSAWFARLKHMRLLPDVRLVAPGAMYLDVKLAPLFDRLYVFSRGEIPSQEPAMAQKYVFLPLPGPFETLPPSKSSQPPYIFAGGGARRDFATLIEAVRELDVQLKLVTFSPNSLGYAGQLPDNVQLLWKIQHAEFLELMAGALFVVVPLKPGRDPHGHTTVVEALCLGKAVISSRNASIDDYLTYGEEGLLVEPGDMLAYRQAVLKMLDDGEFRQACERKAKQRAADLTYPNYARRLAAICTEVMSA